LGAGAERSPPLGYALEERKTQFSTAKKERRGWNISKGRFGAPFEKKKKKERSESTRGGKMNEPKREGLVESNRNGLDNGRLKYRRRQKGDIKKRENRSKRKEGKGRFQGWKPS